MTVGMIYKRLFFKHPPDIPQSIPLELRQIIHDCLETDPRVRPTFRSIQQRILKIDIESNGNYDKQKIKVNLKQIDRKQKSSRSNKDQMQQQQILQGESQGQMKDRFMLGND